MAATTSEVEVEDGSFRLHLAPPAGSSGPGVLVLHEIYGVNSYIEDVCRRLAGEGYVAAAPDLFWRVRPGIALEGRDPATIAEGLGYGKQLDFGKAVADLVACLAALRRLPEVRGEVGVVGFCLGGTLAYLLAAAGDPAVAVSYYGAGVPRMLDRLDEITCPVLFVFGGADPVITSERVAAVQAAAAGRTGVTVHVAEDAGHAFDNHTDPDGYDAEAAAAAWSLTSALLARTLRLGGAP